MKKNAKTAYFLACIFAFLLPASAQEMGVRGNKFEYLTFADQVSLIVEPRNTSSKKAKMQVRVYDHNFRLIKARVSPREFTLQRGAKRSVKVTVPFLGETKKRFRVCTETVLGAGGTQQVRTRVCGRFYAAQVQ